MAKTVKFHDPNQEVLFLELKDTAEHKAILRQARKAKGLNEEVSDARTKFGEAKDKLIDLLIEADISAFDYDGMIVKVTDKHNVSIRTKRKKEPKVEAEMAESK